MRSRISTEFWVISGLFIAGLFVRLYHLGTLSLWDDEIYTVTRIDHSFLDTVSLIRHTEFPPLHYAILNLWVSAFGKSEWALRFPSAIFSSLTVISVYKLGKELFSKEVGLLSALLLIFSPFAINYAQNAKMYALYWLLTPISFLFFFRFLKDQKNGPFGPYIFTSVLCCYTMYTGFLILMTQSMIFLLMGEKARWKKWFTGQLIIVSICVPWVIYYLCSWHEGFYLRPSDAGFNYFTFFLGAFTRILGDYETQGKLVCFLYVFLITYLLIDVLTIAYKNKKMKPPLLTTYYCLFIWLIFPVLMYLTGDYFFVRAHLAERYIGILQIPLILLVSSQICNFRGLIKKILVAVIIIIAMNNTYLYFRDNLRIPEEDWRLVTKVLAQDLKKNDIILSLVSTSLIEYYYKNDKHILFEVLKKDCTSEYLAKMGLLREDVHAVFVIYRDRPAPQIQLNGFSMDHKFSKGLTGFLHFQRTH